MSTAIIRSSGRKVPIIKHDDMFWIIRPQTGYTGAQSISGPYHVKDKRFKVKERNNGN